MINLYDYTLKKLEDLLINEYAQKKYRASQLFSWIYKKEVTDFSLMSDVALSFREVLLKDFSLELPKIYQKQVSDDGTIKLLLELSDGSKIETAMLPYNYGNAICVTSEVGCSMSCAFCASGLLKKKRNLTVSEMVGQILVVNSLLKEKGEKITHVVVMGTGEPFDNYDNVLDFIRIINDPKALEIGARHITISTCGLIPGILRYADEGLQTNLAISLHASNDELRNSLMPINKVYPLKELLKAIKYYQEHASRRVTFEYILLKGVNDSLDNAKELADLIDNDLTYIVNLIPYNAVKEKNFKRSDDKTAHAFFSYLKKRHINVTIRKEFGKDIDAACGQLRAKEYYASKNH